MYYELPITTVSSFSTNCQSVIENNLQNSAVLQCPFCGSKTVFCLTQYQVKKCENG